MGLHCIKIYFGYSLYSLAKVNSCAINRQVEKLFIYTRVDEKRSKQRRPNQAQMSSNTFIEDCILLFEKKQQLDVLELGPKKTRLFLWDFCVADF